MDNIAAMAIFCRLFMKSASHGPFFCSDVEVSKRIQIVQGGFVEIGEVQKCNFVVE